MFDIAFTELMIVAVAALIIIGPERLPRVARQAGEWLGKLQRYVNDVKSDINRQMELDELRNLKTEVTSAAREMESSFKETVSETQGDFDEIGRTIAGEPEPDATVETDWERIYEARRVRERLRDRRIERERELGRKRPKRRTY